MKKCKHCDSDKHYSLQCFLAPRRPMKVKEPMKKMGKVGKQWVKTRREWIRQNKDTEYKCYLCGKRLDETTLTLDHVRSRSRHPELRYELSNLRPCCAQCNENKGSRDITELEGI